MKKRIIMLLAAILVFTALFSSTLYTDSIECDNTTLIITVCTDNMRALETGISAYAGYQGAPLILSDKTLPEQLENWLPGYVEENNITRIIVVGPVTAQQLYDLVKLGVEVKQINGESIADILTKIASNTKETKQDTIIITASDPQAGVLGAYTKTPVFITADNSTYTSAQTLNPHYKEYITKHNTRHAIIVGSIPESIRQELEQLNMTIEEITGTGTIELSANINHKLRNEGYLKNTTSAYYGFFGELPTITPQIIRNNAIMIEDTSNSGDIMPILREHNITEVTLTRNSPSDYIQMEETDYIPPQTTKTLKENNITIKYLTRKRTLDEATGLYDTKIMTAQEKQENLTDNNPDTILETEPPLLEIMNHKKITDSNNLTATITGTDNHKMLKWNTIHPYTYKIQKDECHITSSTGYDYCWTRTDKGWHVQYKYRDKDYYNITWTQNNDFTWTEEHPDHHYTWKYDGKRWKCYDNNTLIYYIEHDD